MTIIIEQKDNKCTVKIYDDDILWRSDSGNIEYEKLKMKEMNLDLQRNNIITERIEDKDFK